MYVLRFAPHVQYPARERVANPTVWLTAAQAVRRLDTEISRRGIDRVAGLETVRIA